MPADLAFVQSVGRSLPGTEESSSYGTPALKVKGKLFARLSDDGRTLVVGTSFEDRDFLLTHHPAVCFLTDHYRDYPWVLVRQSKVTRSQLRELLEHAWRRVAPRRLIQQFDSSPRR